jgi:hypothetical protein
MDGDAINRRKIPSSAEIRLRNATRRLQITRSPFFVTAGASE